MGSIFGNGRSSAEPLKAASLRISSSIQGRPKAIVFGQARIAPTLTDYAGFKATPSQNQGGKGGALGAVFKGQNSGYTYSVSAIASIGEANAGILTIYNGSAIDFIVPPAADILAALQSIGITPSYGNGIYNIEYHGGGPTQAVSPYWSSAFPSRALAYRNESYVAFPNLALGSSATFPNFNFEILGTINTDIPAIGPDANFSDVANDLLTNSVYGLPGFSSSFVGDFSTAKNYWRATGLLVSDALSSPKALNSYFKDVGEALNVEYRWSNGKLDIVPLGDVAITANGYTYNPNITPIYDLTIDDFLPNPNASGNGTTPVVINRKSPYQIKNKIQIEYYDRKMLYNPALVYAVDEADAAQSYLRLADKKTCGFFALQSAAQMSAILQLHREKATAFKATCVVGKKYGLLEPLDLITITEPALQLDRQLCRILEISEDSEQTRTLTLEFVPLSAAAPAYGSQASLGSGRNNNAPAENVNFPIFWEPPDQIGKGLVVYIGLSGRDMTNFGGAEVWVSTDNQTYKYAGIFQGSSRMGVTTADLPPVAISPSGTTIDNDNILSVDLTESIGSLLNGSAQDFAALNTSVLVGDEIMAYQDAALTAAYKYDLSPLSRGAYESMISDHPSGSQFMRIDGNYFSWEYTADHIGQIVYFKFLSFNPFGAGKQQLSDVGNYPYKLTGAAFASSLPGVSNLRTVYEAGTSKIWWDEISDFRPILYEIRKGMTWTTAPTVAVQAHPPFIAFGDDTYWISAKTLPASGILVYSSTPQSIAIAGALLSQNIVINRDEKADGWRGSFTNGAGTQGSNPNAFIQLGSGDNILTAPDILAINDIIYNHGVIASGSYEIPGSNVIDVGYIAQCLIGVNYVPSAFPVGQNILTIEDILAQTDILGSTAARFVDVHIEIATSADLEADVFLAADAFENADMFAGTVIWGPWQKFVPGVYVARFVKFRVSLSTLDSTIVPVCLSFSYAVTVPARHDHYQNVTVPAAGLTISFIPDGAAVNAPFNGGPDGNPFPYISASWQNQPGDTFTYTISRSSVFVQFLNGGVGVTRTGVNFDVEGY